MNSHPLLFKAPNSSISPLFWQELYERKLNVYKLDDSSRSIKAKLTRDSCLVFDNNSFLSNDNNDHDNNDIIYQGELINVNTKIEFQDIDKRSLIEKVGEKLLELMKNGDAISDPSLLLHFVFLSYADLKDYSFLYWLCTPAIVPTNHPFTFASTPIKPDNMLIDSIYQHLISSKSFQHVFVIMKDSLEVINLKDGWARINDENSIVVVVDMEYDKSSYGWHLRNVLALLSVHDVMNKSIITLRNPRMNKIHSSSVEELLNADISMFIQVLLGNKSILNDYKVVGWEYNQRSKPGPRIVNCSSFMNTKEVMIQAVDLNIKLMKWREWPELDTEKLSRTKCLLFGAGTLGCAVARCLLGYGIKHITFVDNGRVSYSNPVRQSLFEFEDCGNPKALAATNRLKKIYPNIESNGIVLTLPMPGHAIALSNDSENEEAINIIKKVDELVQSHDVCFALTDSREARWLPTMMCAAYDKLLINCALGFDSYLVMRHGSGDFEDKTRLGCYYCQDIVAATNSQKNRSIDQQCTVTRPGNSFIASGLAVEMMVSILHSPHGNKHPTPTDNLDVDPIPHQIRGSLYSFNQDILRTPCFPCCTACSLPIVESYRNQGYNFIINVCNDPSILESISGIEKITSDIDLKLCIDSDEEF